MDIQKMKVINIVSGKGGTGKTLMVAVLADMLGNRNIPTLTVDLDVFVRGLTVLLYYQRNLSNKLIDDGQLSVADIFKSKRKIIDLITNRSFHSPLGISRYRYFDVLPAVKRVNELLDFKNTMPTYDEANRMIHALLETIKKEGKYKVVLLDSRAGFDELVLATTHNSDITICVEEDDAISKVTSDNLVNQIEKDLRDSPRPYRVVNKARNTDKINPSRQYINYLGVIPFDIDVMNSFGDQTFWEDISSSLYKQALLSIWNKLCLKEQLNYELSMTRINPVIFDFLERRIGFFTRNNRLLFMYGILLSLLGFIVSFSDTSIISILKENPYRIVGILSLVIGISLSLLAVFSRGLKLNFLFRRKYRKSKKNSYISR